MLLQFINPQTLFNAKAKYKTASFECFLDCDTNLAAGHNFLVLSNQILTKAVSETKAGRNNEKLSVFEVLDGLALKL